MNDNSIQYRSDRDDESMTAEDMQGAPMDETTVYADMKALLSAEVEDNLIELHVPSRQKANGGVLVRYNATFDYDTYNRWMKQATRGKGNNKKIEPKLLALIVLRNTCAGTILEKDSKRSDFTINGKPQTFDSPAVQEMVGTMSGWSGAIESMYKNDGHMLITMNKIITEAGYAEMDLDDVDGYDPLGG